LDAENALAHFNLGSVLEEVGEVEAARQHLRQAVRLDPDYPDAHYNLAFVCEKLDADAEAQQHWEAYVRLDPAGPWCNYARQRLASSKTARSAGTT
jgi:tetratricopeptide (TPR) repeat protein